MTVAQIIGLVVVVLLTVFGGIMIVKKSKKHNLLKWISLFILMALCLTWIFQYGYYQNAVYYEYGMNYQGISDIPNIIYYSISFACDKIIYLLALGAFYAVMSKNKGYKKLVTSFAKAFKGKEILFAVLCSALLVVLTSLLGQTFIVLLFVPFLVSVILSMNLDKMTAFSVTFGAILVGMLGLTYGGEGFVYFNQYSGIESVTGGILYRLLVLVLAFFIYTVINILHIKKTLKGSKVNELDADPFKVEEVKDAKAWPIAVVYGVLFVLFILGFVNWNGNFGVECFNKFHEWLTSLQIGDFAIFQTLFGNLSAALGTWNLYHGTLFLMLTSVIVALMSRLKLDEFVEAYGEGIKKISKSLGLFIAVYVVMVIAYMSPFVPTITNLLTQHVSKFNPFVVSLGALVANLFQTDLGFTGYIVGSYYTTTYASNVTVIQTIFVTLYGLLQVIAPTSAVLLIGLSYLDIDYKSWVKYIWIFALAMLAVLLILFTVMTYI